MAAPVQVRVSVTEYRFSHRRDPRGEGWWWFEGTSAPRATAVYKGPVRFSFNGMYSDAKAAAIRWAKTMGLDSIQVCS